MSTIITNSRLLQVVIWLVLLVIIFTSAVVSEPDPNRENLFENMFILALLWLTIIAASYTSLYLHTRLFLKQRYVAFTLALPVTVVVIVLTFRYVAELWMETSFAQSFFSDLVSFSLVMSFAIGMRYAKQGLLDRYLLKEMQTQLLKAELNALKSQLNPHFLFNTLNNIYGVNLTDPQRGSEMILNLSEMFRYFLEAQKRDKVTLGEELNLLRNYIDLERMRLTPANHIELTILADNRNCLLPPLLLMPLVENAIKYGVHPAEETVILIDIKQSEHELILTTQNNIHFPHRMPSTRTGLKNLRERLERLYPGRFTLQSAENNSKWQAKLVIPL
jgi:two-component system LytT family sensor kinase